MRNPLKFLNAHYLTYPLLVHGMLMKPSWVIRQYSDMKQPRRSTALNSSTYYFCHTFRRLTTSCSCQQYSLVMEFTLLLHIWNDLLSTCETHQESASCSTSLSKDIWHFWRKTSKNDQSFGISHVCTHVRRQSAHDVTVNSMATRIITPFYFGQLLSGPRSAHFIFPTYLGTWSHDQLRKWAKKF